MDYKSTINLPRTPFAMKVLTIPSATIRARLLQEGRVQAALRHHQQLMAITNNLNVALILSEAEDAEVVVTGPGPGSGKLATCLCNLYHEYKDRSEAGYAKFETFPIWNLPVNHPVNIAYEAATADIEDFNLIDPFHLEAYDKKAVNYNRDVEVFPVIKRILKKINGGESPYQSPTDMGVNQVGFAIRGTASQQTIEQGLDHRPGAMHFPVSCNQYFSHHSYPVNGVARKHTHAPLLSQA